MYFRLLIFILSSWATTFLQAQSLNSTVPNLKIKKTDSQGIEQSFTVQDAVQLVRFFMAQDGIERCESDLYNRKLKLVARPDIDIYALLQKNTIRDKMAALGYNITPSHTAPIADTPSGTPNNPAVSSDPTPKNAASSGKTTTTTDKKALLEKAKALSAAKSGSAAPAKSTSPATAKPDCADCGEVKLDQQLKESITKNADYGGSELMIDMPLGNFDGSSGSGASPMPNHPQTTSPSKEQQLSPPPMNQHQLDSLRQILFKKRPK